MLQIILRAVVAVLLCAGATSAHTIQLKAHSRECFHEQLHRDDRMTVTFQVGDREFGNSGNLDIDFFVWALATHSFVPILIFLFHRSRTLPTNLSTIKNPSPWATTPSMRSKMENTYTASATSIGRQAARRCRLTYTELSMFRSRMRHRIHWRKKVCISMVNAGSDG